MCIPALSLLFTYQFVHLFILSLFSSLAPISEGQILNFIRKNLITFSFTVELEIEILTCTDLIFVILGQIPILISTDKILNPTRFWFVHWHNN